MTALATCPHCLRRIRVRTDQRIPRHWPTELAERDGDPKCPGSELGTRFWPVETTADGPARYDKRSRRT